MFSEIIEGRVGNQAAQVVAPPGLEPNRSIGGCGAGRVRCPLDGGGCRGFQFVLEHLEAVRTLMTFVAGQAGQ